MKTEKCHEGAFATQNEYCPR